jgi:hypothetical protein
MCAPREARKRRAGCPSQLQTMLEREIIGVSANG